MKRISLNFIKVILALYVVLSIVLYFYQEKLIFLPQKLEKTHHFNFSQEFEELNFKTNDDKLINGLLFKSEQSKGLIFYLHGNAGSLNSWGNIAKTYTDLNYDIFILDYRGYGKSEGTIISQKQLFEDNQMIYYELLKNYNEENIVIIGYSIGTGLASKLASDNNPKQLILQAPYYSMTDIVQYKFPYSPTFVLKYKLSTYEYLKKCKMPITIFHGTNDRVIYYGSSLKLKKEFKEQINFISLKDEGHNGMTYNKDYIKEIKKVLDK